MNSWYDNLSAVHYGNVNQLFSDFEYELKTKVHSNVNSLQNCCVFCFDIRALSEATGRDSFDKTQCSNIHWIQLQYRYLSSFFWNGLVFVDEILKKVSQDSVQYKFSILFRIDYSQYTDSGHHLYLYLLGLLNLTLMALTNWWRLMWFKSSSQFDTLAEWREV